MGVLNPPEPTHLPGNYFNHPRLAERQTALEFNLFFFLKCFSTIRMHRRFFLKKEITNSITVQEHDTMARDDDQSRTCSDGK